MTIRLVHPPPGGPVSVEVWKTEEKGSDVNLAILLRCDGYGHDDGAAVVSQSEVRLEHFRFHS